MIIFTYIYIYMFTFLCNVGFIDYNLKLCVCLCEVWNAERGTLLRTFEEEHEEQINHCVFTNGPRCLLLATCSNDSFMNTKVLPLLTPRYYRY